MLVLMAILLNVAVFGSKRFQDVCGLPRLQALAYTTIRSIERKLNRSDRTLKERQWRGVILLVAVILASLGVGVTLQALLAHGMHLGELALLSLLLPIRPCWQRINDMYRDLRSHNTVAARLHLKGTVWRHYALLDEHALARAATEILAVQFSEKTVAPIMWYLAFGLPGLCVNKACYMLKESLCQPSAGDNAFTKPVQLLHFIMNYIPSRLCLLLWLMAMIFVPAQGLIAALKALFTSRLASAMPEEISVLAVACALNLSLGGPTSVYTSGKWQGAGSAKATSADVKRVQMLWLIVHGLLVLVIALSA